MRGSMKISVLVTGGAGYVGAHACKALAQAGYRPVVYDNLSLGHGDFVRWGPLVEADIANSNAVRDCCKKFEIKAALHFAAFALVGESVGNPALYYANNVAGTLGLLKGLLEADVKRMVFSSSCAVYGAPAQQPIAEDTPANPVNPYGASKLMIERVLADYASAYDFHSIALRYFNACGADPDAEVGELRKQETHLIPRAMMWLQGHLDEFHVFGADYPTKDGTAVRDYVHVTDLADAHVAALGALLSGTTTAAFNLGTGEGHSVKEVLRQIEQTTGRRFPDIAGPRRPGDPPVLVANAERARQLLGFAPRRSDLETIVRTAWAWHQKAHPHRR